jgi:site-specific recombinase XerC
MRLSSRKGLVIVRMGKGNTYREVPLNAEVRTALNAWLEQRKQWVSQGNETALFLTIRGTRLATRSMDDVVRRLEREANLSLSAPYPAAHLPDQYRSLWQRLCAGG